MKKVAQCLNQSFQYHNESPIHSPLRSASNSPPCFTHEWRKFSSVMVSLFLNTRLQHQNESPMHPPSRSVKSRPICVTHEWMKIRSSHTCSADSRLSECLAQDSRLLSIFLNFESVTSAIVRVVLGVRVVRGVRVVHGVRVSSVLFAAFALFAAFVSHAPSVLFSAFLQTLL